MKPIILIHPFQVHAEQEQEFLNAWHTVDHYMQTQQGFIATQLHRALNTDHLATFRFINVAQWQNVESFQAAIHNDTFKRLAKIVLKFSRGPGLYEVCN